MKYLFHTVTLGQTGGARVILNLAEILVERGHTVEIVVERNKVAYELPEGVTVRHLTVFGLKNVPKYLPSAKKVVKKNLKSVENKLKPKSHGMSVAFKWFKYILSLILQYPIKYLVIKKYLRRYKPDLIASHNMYQDYEHFFFYRSHPNFYLVVHNSPKEVFCERLSLCLFPVSFYLNRVKTVSVSEDASAELDSLFGSTLGERFTIYNPFDFELIRSKGMAKLQDELPKSYFISVAALAPRKRLDRLILALNEVQNNDIHLVLLGEGEELSSLKGLAVKLDLTDRVHFKGFCSNPFPVIKQSKALVMSSDSEGLPTVLIESLILGTPVISTDCPTGPREILIGDLSPYLVSMESEERIVSNLADRMVLVLNNTPTISNESLLRFSKGEIAKKWELLAGSGNVSSIGD